MTPQEELELLELEAKAKGWKVDAAPVTAPPEETPMWKRALTGEGFATGSGAALTGLTHAARKASAGLTGAAEWLGGDYLGKPVAGFMREHGMAPTEDQLARGKAAVEAGGTPAKIGEITGDVGISLLPSSAALKGAQAVKAAPALNALPSAIRSALAGGANVAGQAGVSAALAPEDRGTAAAFGGGGAMLGGALARGVGGPLRTAMTPEAQVLADKGVYLTPGQMVSGENANWMAKSLRGAEDKIGSIPILGDVIKHGQEKSIKSFGLSEVNDALSHISAKVKEAGASGIHEAQDLISKAYDDVLPNIFVPVSGAAKAVTDTLSKFKNAPLFTDKHAHDLEKLFTDRVIKPLVVANKAIPGDIAKQVDALIGEQAREQATSLATRPLAKAFADLQKNWRDAMVGTTSEAKDVLRSANTAFRKLLPLEAASEASATGVFTPGQVRRASLKLKIEPSDVNDAARQVLPSTVPDSGTAGRQILHTLITPASAGAGAAGAAASGIAPALLGTAALAAGAYTRPGSKYLSGGILPVVNALRGNKLSPQELEDITRLLATQGVRAAGD